MILDLIQNVTLLVTLALGVQMLARYLAGRTVAYRLVAGLLFGGIGVLGMMTPIHFAEGVIYDGRSIVLALAGLFGGPLTASVAALVAGLYRLFLGGAGVVAGVGTVVEAAALGVLLHHLRRRDERWVGLPALWAFGLVVHLIMLALQWLIPGIDGWEIMRRVGPTVLAFFPAAFVLMSFAFLEGERIRRRDEELRDTEERLRLVLDGAELGAWDLDVAAMRIQVNGRWAAMLGYAPDEVVPDLAWWEDLIHPDDLYSVRRSMQDHLDGRTEQYQAELRMRHRSGRWIWVLDRGKVLARDDAGRPLRACGTLLDITRSRELEDRLRQMEKMESVGQLAGGVAHDFNNMLSVILGHAELALEQVRGDETLGRDLQAIRRAAERSAALTSQLLAFARKQTVAPRLLDLNRTVEELLVMLRRLIGEDVALLWEPDREPCPVQIDPSQVDQILTNLAVNARDAIAGVGKLTIETACVAIDQAYCDQNAEASPGRYVMLAVSDDGAGMEPAIREKIFDPFFTTKPQGQGTGLGLATVYGIVKQNQGFINIYSEPGHGSTFRIYLPRALSEGAEDPDAAVPPAPAVDVATILLVEDEPTLLELAHRQLEQTGHRVLAAGTPGEARALARRHEGPIHLLVTDVVMPEMNGRDLWRELAALRPDLKCLFMSGYTANVIAHRGVLDEGVNFLQKPFTIRELADKLREALAG